MIIHRTHLETGKRRKILDYVQNVGFQTFDKSSVSMYSEGSDPTIFFESICSDAVILRELISSLSEFVDDPDPELGPVVGAIKCSLSLS